MVEVWQHHAAYEYSAVLQHMKKGQLSYAIGEPTLASY